MKWHGGCGETSMKFDTYKWFVLISLVPTFIACQSVPTNGYLTRKNVCGGTISAYFINGLANGRGTATCTNGDNYVGEFKDDKIHGQGTYTYANGDKYVGEHKDNKKHGQGTLTYANGHKYVGEFKDNKSHGQGTY